MPPDHDDASLRRFREFVADRDVMCPGCGYNLRGSTAGVCPECGAFLMPPGESLEEPGANAAAVARYLKTHDLVCRGCQINLRGHTDDVCPICGMRYQVTTAGGRLHDGAPPQGVGRLFSCGVVTLFVLAACFLLLFLMFSIGVF